MLSAMLSHTTVAKPSVITRPADTAAYAAGDVYGTSTSAPVLQYVELSKLDGAGITICQVRQQTNNVLWAGTRLRVHFYNDSITPINDNAPFEMLDANAAKRIGYVDVTLEVANGGASDSVAGLNTFDLLKGQLAGKRLYYQVEVRDAKTPVSGQKLLTQVVAYVDEVA